MAQMRLSDATVASNARSDRRQLAMALLAAMGLMLLLSSGELSFRQFTEYEMITKEVIEINSLENSARLVGAQEDIVNKSESIVTAANDAATEQGLVLKESLPSSSAAPTASPTPLARSLAPSSASPSSFPTSSPTPSPTFLMRSRAPSSESPSSLPTSSESPSQLGTASPSSSAPSIVLSTSVSVSTANGTRAPSTTLVLSVNETKVGSSQSRMPTRAATKRPTRPPKAALTFPPAFMEPPPAKPVLGKLTCIQDNETLWEMRRQYARNLTQESCGSLPRLGTYQRRPGTIPVIMTIAQKKNDAHRGMAILTATQAAKFNDMVYIIVLGKDIWKLANDSMLARNNIKVSVHNGDTDPLMTAMRSFNSSTYVHKSTNPYVYELFCFQRWFAIVKFVDMYNIDMSFVIDSDILLFRNVTQEFDQCYGGCHMSAPEPRATYSAFWSKETLFKYTEYLRYLYTSKRFETLYRWPSFSDMSAMDDFIQQTSPAAPKCIQAETRHYDLRNPSNWHVVQGKATFDNMIYRKYLSSFFQDDLLQMPYFYGYKGYMRNYHLKSLHFQGPMGKRDLVPCIQQWNLLGRRRLENVDQTAMNGRYWGNHGDVAEDSTI